jgi:hypothetical protein
MVQTTEYFLLSIILRRTNSSLLVILLISNLFFFFPLSFSFPKWIPITFTTGLQYFSLKTLLLTEITLGGPNSLLGLLLNDLFQSPKSTSLANQNLPRCVTLFFTPLPLCLADFRKSYGRVLGRRRLLYACEKEQSLSAKSSTTAVLQNMYIPRLSSRLPSLFL